MLNAKVKIVDFVIDNILVEVSGYAYNKWQDDFDEKIKYLRQSVDNPMIFLTYKENVDEMFFRLSRQETGDNIFIGDIYDDKYILKTIKFINEINKINEGIVECLE